MKYAIIYSSTGNTKLLGDKVEEYLKDSSNELVYCGDTSDKALDADRIYVGFWTNKGTADDKTIEFLKKLSNQEVFLYGSAGFGMSEDYFTQIINRIKEIIPQGVKIVGHFMCQGKMQMSVRERYMKMKEEKANIPNIDMLIKNFDMALSHPDENDFENLKNALVK